MRQRAPIIRPQASREFVDATLAELRDSPWSARGWARFVAENAARSYNEANRHPRGAAELTAGHLLLLAARPSAWVESSWLMAITHLGFLGPELDEVGWANRVSLLRANLPALAP